MSVQYKEWKFPEQFAKLPEGVWTKEPDKLQWTDKETGYDCLIVRNTLGALCGYVAVPKNHSLYEQEYHNIPDLDVHGGITFSGACHGDPNGLTICHLDDDGDKAWWFGFDCAHVGDTVPYDFTYGLGYRRDGLGFSAVYRDINYVRTEVRRLAQQLMELEYAETSSYPN